MHVRSSKTRPRWRRVVHRLAVAVAFVPLAGLAISERATATEECTIAPDPDWTETEAWVWEQLCLYGEADLGKDAGKSGLRAPVVATMIGTEPYGSHIDTRPATVRSADISGALQLSGLNRERALTFASVTFESNVDMTFASVGTRVSFENSTMDKLDLGHIAAITIDLTNIQANRVNLQGARTRSDIDATGARVLRTLSANAATVGGSFVITSGCFNEVTLVSTTVGLDFVARAATFIDIPKADDAPSLCARPNDLQNVNGLCLLSPPDRDPEKEGLAGGTLRLNALTVMGSIYLGSVDVNAEDLRRGCFQEVEILSSDVGVSVDTDRAWFIRKLRLNGSGTGGTVYLRGATFFDQVDLGTGRFGNNVIIEAASIHGEVTLFGSEVRGSLILGWCIQKANQSADKANTSQPDATSQREPPLCAEQPLGMRQPTVWHPDSRLTLTGTKTVAVSDRSGLESTSPEAWPAVIDLEGFEYSASGTQSGFLDRDHEWYADWLDRDDDFSEQPYVQLEDALRESGRDGAADEIAILRRNREQQEQPFPGRILWWLWGVTLGYGYSPENALFILVAITLLGALVICGIRSDVRRALGVSHPLMFSLQRAIPFPRLGAAHDVDLGNGIVPRSVRAYFVAHTAIGYVVPLYVVTVVRSLIVS